MTLGNRSLGSGSLSGRFYLGKLLLYYLPKYKIISVSMCVVLPPLCEINRVQSYTEITSVCVWHSNNQKLKPLRTRASNPDAPLHSCGKPHTQTHTLSLSHTHTHFPVLKQSTQKWDSVVFLPQSLRVTRRRSDPQIPCNSSYLHWSYLADLNTTALVRSDRSSSGHRNQDVW